MCPQSAKFFHEAGHWSGHRTRLDRLGFHQPNSKEYAFEELVAELTSAYLCAHLEMKAELRHAGLPLALPEVMKVDDTAFFRAAAAAQRATDYLRAFCEPKEKEGVDQQTPVKARDFL